MKKELNPVELDFLLRFPFKAGVVSPVDFLQHQSWGGIKVGLGPGQVRLWRSLLEAGYRGEGPQ
jgi:hypothetical protein